jgi:outer membrane protein OmpA-like peptidoglycan-associated protein
MFYRRERLGATQFASAELKAARQALQRAEEAVADGSDPEDRLGLSREAVRLAVQAQATAEERLLEAQIAEEHRRNEHRLAQLREAIQAAQSEVERARLEAEEWRLKADMEQQARQQAMQRIEELRAETARAEERGRQQGLDEARDTEWRRYQELVLEQQRREQRLLEAERALRQAEQAQQQLAKRQQDMQNQEAVTEQQRADLMAAQQEVERAQALLNQAREQVDQARLEAQQAKAKLQKERQAHQQIQTQLDQLQEEQTQTLKQLRNALGPIVETRETMEGLVLNVPDTLFEFDSARLKPQARKVLEKVAEALKAVGDYRLTIEGHTDNVGRAEYNQELSRARADSVREFLIQSGVDSNLVVAVRGLGEQEPIASNDSAAGREDNRRVEILVQNPAGAPTRAE